MTCVLTALRWILITKLPSTYVLLGTAGVEVVTRPSPVSGGMVTRRMSRNIQTCRECMEVNLVPVCSRWSVTVETGYIRACLGIILVGYRPLTIIGGCLVATWIIRSFCRVCEFCNPEDSSVGVD